MGREKDGIVKCFCSLSLHQALGTLEKWQLVSTEGRGKEEGGGGEEWSGLVRRCRVFVLPRRVLPTGISREQLGA